MALVQKEQFYFEVPLAIKHWLSSNLRCHKYLKDKKLLQYQSLIAMRLLQDLLPLTMMFKTMTMPRLSTQQPTYQSSVTAGWPEGLSKKLPKNRKRQFSWYNWRISTPFQKLLKVDINWAKKCFHMCKIAQNGYKLPNLCVTDSELQ